MSNVIQCFMLEPTTEAQESLRRYARRLEPDEKGYGVLGGSSRCPLSHGYHNASVVIGRRDLPLDEPNGMGRDVDGEAECEAARKAAGSEPLWPVACACGYAFKADDHWQYNTRRFYRRSDTGELVTLDDAPIGAMWFAPWYEDVYKGADGRCLVVKTPGGEWIVDGGASNGAAKNAWTRTGTPPLVTASPSIGMHNPDGSWRYHGWLRNGRLEEC